jgi:TonB dependent receptor/TonB-dependent Receptor Plug Domain
VGNAELARRPILRPGEVLEAVPGVIVTQHAGGGKANQYFLRGFNLDHGTDFATSVDGVPINLGSHAHGQGYTDTNWLIPELIRGVDYRKGPYFADTGDFGSAGAANIRYFDHLDRALAKVEGGTDHYARVVLADSVNVAGGNFFYGLEGYHDDGPWKNPANYWRTNGVMKFSRGDASLGWSVSAFGYHGTWRSTDQIPERAITGDNSVPGGFQIDRFGTLDPYSGGGTERASLSAEWHRADEKSASSALVYGYHYGLDLYSNFTGYLNQTDGDEIFQRDRRIVTGVKLAHTWFTSWAGHDGQTRAGLDVRADFVDVGLFDTVQRRVLSTVRTDDLSTRGVSPWAEQKFSWTQWFRTVLGLRGDLYAFDVQNHVGGISASDNAAIASPKASLIFGPWLDTELYLSAGLGFHTADARAVAVTTNKASIFTRQQGAEVGVRFAHLDGLQSTASLWLLDSDNESVFDGDVGATEPSGRKGRRYGVEWTNYYDATRWLALDCDLALSRARFRDHEPAIGDYIPDSVTSVAAAGISVHQGRGAFGSIRLRYFGPRPLIEDDSVRSNPSTIVNVKVGYRLDQTWTFSADILNALNTKADDQEYYYSSRLPNEPENPANRVARGGDGGYYDLMVHPMEPLSVRIAVSARY